MQRVARISGGFALITAGTAMIFLPGPGLLTIAGGLALLSKDVEWAGRASDWFTKQARRIAPPPPDRDGG
ncbi:MAG: PGPGW domain-containing protein [Acidimicrobiia bacterium]